MKILLACLLLVSTASFGQESVPIPSGPFHLNFRVIYGGAKEHPELAAFIYKSLRDLPGVGIVDDDPDATLVIGEFAHNHQYACSFTVMIHATPEIRSAVDMAVSTYDEEQTEKEVMGETVDAQSRIKSTWRKELKDCIRGIGPVYRLEGGWLTMHESPKLALQTGIKTVDLEYVEKQRRHYQYLLAHPLIIPPFKRTPIPEQPTTTPTPAPLSLALPADTPEPLLGPDFTPPAKR